MPDNIDPSAAVNKPADQFQIARAAVDQLFAYLGEQPHKIANPIIAFLQQNLKEVKEVAPKAAEPSTQN